MKERNFIIIELLFLAIVVVLYLLILTRGFGWR
jgi:hypothetical protein